jgi:hypothetical protein
MVTMGTRNVLLATGTCVNNNRDLPSTGKTKDEVQNLPVVPVLCTVRYRTVL